VDGLHPYASNTVRGQVTPTMMFAEVQLLAEQPVLRREHSLLLLEFLPVWDIQR
jgi:hypothetical protein